ncbi:DNA topoisomerase 3-alpha-like [Senna tora]|uniref:DNA topoisomerase 3-alpha-like n=1 Tax=Senna tora TaxID=362788 RepID=A0A834SNV6_9FABA|nr:DNA topoisomerase 3-alpha-like [Senna tora]
MASQNSSSSSSRARVVCDCGEYAVVATSRTPENPGRRFWGCKNYLSSGNCGFLGWRRIANLEAQLEDKKKRNEEDLKKIESLQGKKLFVVHSSSYVWVVYNLFEVVVRLWQLLNWNLVMCNGYYTASVKITMGELVVLSLTVGWAVIGLRAVMVQWTVMLLNVGAALLCFLFDALDSENVHPFSVTLLPGLLEVVVSSDLLEENVKFQNREDVVACCFEKNENKTLLECIT